MSARVGCEIEIIALDGDEMPAVGLYTFKGHVQALRLFDGDPRQHLSALIFVPISSRSCNHAKIHPPQSSRTGRGDSSAGVSWHSPGAGRHWGSGPPPLNKVEWLEQLNWR